MKTTNQDRVDIAKSLFGILPDYTTEEDARLLALAEKRMLDFDSTTTIPQSKVLDELNIAETDLIGYENIKFE